MKTILLPVNGSPLSWRALPGAVALARATTRHITVLRALGGTAPGDEDQAKAYADVGEALVQRIQREYGLEAVAISRVGPPALIIPLEARVQEAFIVAMASYFRPSVRKSIRGSVTEIIARVSPAPVLTIPASILMAPLVTVRRILVPLDGSELAARIIKIVSPLADHLGAELLGLRVSGPGEEALSTGEQGGSNRFRELYAEGDPAQQILAVAKQESADIIALATHGQTGLGHHRPSPVAEQVMHGALCPVLSFGEQALDHIPRTWQIPSLPVAV